MLSIPSRIISYLDLDKLNSPGLSFNSIKDYLWVGVKFLIILSQELSIPSRIILHAEKLNRNAVLRILSIPSRIIMMSITSDEYSELQTFNSIKDYQMQKMKKKRKMPKSFNSIKDYQDNKLIVMKFGKIFQFHQGLSKLSS